MRNRLLALATALCFVAGAEAAERYIVPIHSQGQPIAPPYWFARVMLTNPSPLPLVVHVTDVYSYGNGERCYGQEDFTLKPYETRGLGAGCWNSMSAIAITSEAPLGITSDVSLYVRHTDGDAEVAREAVSIGRHWLDPDKEQVIPDVTVIPNLVRSNLFLINPGAAPIRVRYQRVSDDQANVHEATVQAHSATLIPLPADPTRCISGDVVNVYCSSALKLTADGTFYAAVSVLDNRTNLATFRSPVQ